MWELVEFDLCIYLFFRITCERDLCKQTNGVIIFIGGAKVKQNCVQI